MNNRKMLLRVFSVSFFFLKSCCLFMLLLNTTHLIAQDPPLEPPSPPLACNPAASNCYDVTSAVMPSKFIMTTPANIDFVFDDAREYVHGITYGGRTMLRVEVNQQSMGCKWRLLMYVVNDPSGVTPVNQWETLVTYGGSGNIPNLNLIQVRVYNACGTPVNNGIWQTFANSNYAVIDIIPQDVLVQPGACNGSRVNAPGSYLTNFHEYYFVVDYRITPGYTHRPGAYQIQIVFCLVEASPDP